MALYKCCIIIIIIAGCSTCPASFLMQWVWLSLLFPISCLSFCRPGTRNSLLFLNAKPHSNSSENCLCTSDGFGCGKIVGFPQHLNLNSVTSSIHPVDSRMSFSLYNNIQSAGLWSSSISCKSSPQLQPSWNHAFFLH